MSLTKQEQETIILFNEAEPTASIYTYCGKLKRKLEQLSLQFPSEVMLTETCPTSAVTYVLHGQLVQELILLPCGKEATYA